MLVAWEERRKDFHVMMLHHVATSLLIAASYSLSCAPTSEIATTSADCCYSNEWITLHPVHFHINLRLLSCSLR